MFVLAFSDVNFNISHSYIAILKHFSLIFFRWVEDNAPSYGQPYCTMPLGYGQPKKGWCYMYRHPQHHHPVLFSPRDCMDRSCLTRGSRNFYWKNQRGGRGAIVNPKWPHQTGSGPARTHCGTWWCVQPPEVIDNINRGGWYISPDMDHSLPTPPPPPVWRRVGEGNTPLFGNDEQCYYYIAFHMWLLIS